MAPEEKESRVVSQHAVWTFYIGKDPRRNMKRRYALVMVIIIIILAVGIAAPLVPRLYCEARGGHWNVFRQCIPPTSDGGKACSSSSECEGSCITELSPEDLARVKNGETVHAMGKCSAFKVVVGCLPLVENGTVRIICVD